MDKKFSTLFLNKKKVILYSNGATKEIQCGRSNFYTQAKSDVETQTDRACMDCLKCQNLLGINQHQKDEIDKLTTVLDQERSLRLNAEQLAIIAEAESLDFREQLFLEKTQVIKMEAELSNLRGELKRAVSTSNCYKTKNEKIIGADAASPGIAESQEKVQGQNKGTNIESSSPENEAELASAHAKLSKSNAKVKDLQSRLALVEDEIMKLKNVNQGLKAPDFLSIGEHRPDKINVRKSSSDLDKARHDHLRQRIPSVPPPSFKTVMKAQTKSNLIKSKSHVATLTKPTLVPRQNKSKSFLASSHGNCKMSEKKKNIKIKGKLERSQRIQEKLDRFESTQDQPKNKQDKKSKNKKDKNGKCNKITSTTSKSHSQIPVKSKGFLDKFLSKSQDHEDRGKAKQFLKNTSLDLPDLEFLFTDSEKKPIPLHTKPSIVISSFESGSDWSSSEEEQWVDELSKSGEFNSSQKINSDDMRYRHQTPPPIAPKPGRFNEASQVSLPSQSRGRSPSPCKPLPQIPISQRRTPPTRPTSPNCRASSPFMQSHQSWKMDKLNSRTSAPHQGEGAYCFDETEYKPQLTGYQRAKGPAGRRRPNSKGNQTNNPQNSGHRHMNGII
ncbi:uncharacterized protein LOC117124293 [Anneissia japonica]|uniref:uncharacterized protein LOC117124293 n=1 Tax=Anneissia japonica TaxID=1529436 RepID=UPI0014255682|nr:uncharacterized protein LOC117124293 [Anneissia japonica]XP_033126368.1 uncharacterized protein LOC117124293 [Anneissia japonica]XP_033126369.1 uncharacterized protein LOC117124293 [Anneissia japonica]XP_033126370.1 uncharacterized protein LOC117124293 [Anneissia japonica]